jgi:hypothetical protein
VPPTAIAPSAATCRCQPDLGSPSAVAQDQPPTPELAHPAEQAPEAEEAQASSPEAGAWVPRSRRSQPNYRVGTYLRYAPRLIALAWAKSAIKSASWSDRSIIENLPRLANHLQDSARRSETAGRAGPDRPSNRRQVDRTATNGLKGETIVREMRGLHLLRDRSPWTARGAARTGSRCVGRDRLVPLGRSDRADLVRSNCDLCPSGDRHSRSLREFSRP